jgi:hypothetical protein
MDKPIAFFYPTHKIGGAQLLFARMAVELLKLGKSVIIIDILNGFLTNYVKDEGLNPILKIYDGSKLEIEETICLVQHLSRIRNIRNNLLLTSESTLIFWSIHPHNILSLFKFTPIYTRSYYNTARIIIKFFEFKKLKKINRLLNELHNNDCLYFMDESNYRISYELNLFKLEPNYLPIPINKKYGIKKRNNFDCINFAWIGRITGEKIHPFNKIIKDLDNYKGNKKIYFHIIGYGDLSACNNLRNLRIVEHGIVSKDNLDNLLLDEIDCVFAMGTSVLESSILSIPSVLCDISKTSLPKNYKYKFIYDTLNYSLGTEAHRSDGTLSMNIIIELMSFEDSYRLIGTKCKEYAEKNHSIDRITNKLLTAINNSTFNFDSLKKYY